MKEILDSSHIPRHTPEWGTREHFKGKEMSDRAHCYTSMHTPGLHMCELQIPVPPGMPCAAVHVLSAMGGGSAPRGQNKAGQDTSLSQQTDFSPGEHLVKLVRKG